MPVVERIAHPLALRLLEVARVQDLAPRLRRITLTGDLADLRGVADHHDAREPAPDGA